MHTTKLVILGRDGILNQYREGHVTAPEEWLPIPGALEAVARINHAGWHTVVATNQAGIGRGMIDMSAVNAVHQHMNQQLMVQGGRIDAVFFCPHGPDEGCRCRKPEPGLIELIGERYGVQLANVPVVGDSLRDLQAGAAVGCPTHLVQTGKGAALDAAQIDEIRCRVPGTQVHADLAAFAEHVIQGQRAVRGASGRHDSGFGRLD